MQNQIYLGTCDRRKVVRLLVDAIASTQFDVTDENVPDVVTDEMIDQTIRPKQKLDIETLWGRPFYITERDKTIDLRRFMEQLGHNPEKTVREINKKIREITGGTLM